MNRNDATTHVFSLNGRVENLSLAVDSVNILSFKRNRGPLKSTRKIEIKSTDGFANQFHLKVAVESISVGAAFFLIPMCDE